MGGLAEEETARAAGLDGSQRTSTPVLQVSSEQGSPRAQGAAVESATVSSATPAVAAIYWPATDQPLDAFLAALDERPRDCLLMAFEREGLTQSMVAQMDPFPMRQLLEQSKAVCSRVLPRTSESRLRRDMRCTLDLPGEPVSRCDEAFVRRIDGTLERLTARQAMRAEIEAGHDSSRRVTIMRFERPEAGRARKGASPDEPAVTVEPVVAAGSIVSVPATTQPVEQPLQVSREVSTPSADSNDSPSSSGPPPTLSSPPSPPPIPAATASGAGAAAPADAAAALIRYKQGQIDSSVAAAAAGGRNPASPAPSIERAAVTDASPAGLAQGTLLQVQLTCGTAQRHIRIQDCLAPTPSVAMVIRSDGREQRLSLLEVLRAGPSGAQGLSLSLKAPLEIRMRNVSPSLILGITLTEVGSGRVLAREQVAAGGSITLSR
jgi:hypothetical protein